MVCPLEVPSLTCVLSFPFLCSMHSSINTWITSWDFSFQSFCKTLQIWNLLSEKVQQTVVMKCDHDHIMTWKHFLWYWPFSARAFAGTVSCHNSIVQYITILYTTLRQNKHHNFELRKDAPYLILTNDLWGVYWKDFSNNGIVLYFGTGTWGVNLIILEYSKSSWCMTTVKVKRSKLIWVSQK